MDQMNLSTHVIESDVIYESTDYMEGNVSGDAGELSEEEIYSRVRLVLIWITSFLIVVLNSLVMGILLSANKGHCRMQFYLLNLSIADLCVGLFAAVIDGFLELSDGAWMLGKSLCKIHQFLKDVSIFASIYILVMMSIDRAMIVTKPLECFKTGRRYRWLAIISSWFIATFLSIPSAVLFETIDMDNGTQECHIHFDDGKWWKVLLMMTFLFVFIIPVVMIISSYVTLVFVLCRRYRLRRISATRNGSDRSSRTVEQSNSFIFNSGISRSKFRSIQLTLGVVSGFIICWSPYFVYNMLDVFGVIKEHNIRKPVMILAYLHNVANPIIYFIYHRTLSARPESSPSLETTQSQSSKIRLRKFTKERSCQDDQKPQYTPNRGLDYKMGSSFCDMDRKNTHLPVPHPTPNTPVEKKDYSLSQYSRLFVPPCRFQ